MCTVRVFLRRERHNHRRLLWKLCGHALKCLLIAPAGSLGVGTEADIAVFKLEDVDAQLEDPLGQLRHVTTRLRCATSAIAVSV